jgi:RecA/RadA recombinase
MATYKKSIGQKREERQRELAKAPKSKSVDPMDKLVASLNAQLGGIGHVYTGASIRDTEFQRRTSGVPSIDYITNGGYPKGGLVEFGGEYSSGKTTLALEACAAEQRGDGGAVGWVALEPFSKRWSRERGFFLPFSEEEKANPDTGELTPIDSYDNATELERYRMEQAGITDPYAERSKFVLVQEERGDVALDAALTMLRSNLFAIIVVDSLGVAKSTKWLTEQEVQDAGDFPREARMIGDYTTRACLALNARYDENNQVAKDGSYRLQTTLIHLNHIGVAIGGGTGPKAKHNQQTIKGGEGNKHNHHCIIFLWKGQQHKAEVGVGDDKRPYVYAQDINCIAIKSKIGPSHMQSSYTFYQQDWATFRMGDIDIAEDVVQIGLLAGLVIRSGAWLEYGDVRVQGREAFVTALREDPDTCGQLWQAALAALKR